MSSSLEYQSAPGNVHMNLADQENAAARARCEQRADADREMAN
jgi:hypothetical protein